MATPVLTASGASSANNGTGNFNLSFTPSANKVYLYLACWLVDDNSNANQQPGLTMSVPTGSGNLTATPSLVLLNDTQGDDTWETGCVVYKLQAAASPSGSTTIRLAPSLAVYQWQGFIVEVVDPDETLANIVAQSAEGQTNTIDAGAHTYNLAGSPTSGHTLISVAVYNEDPGSNLVTPTSGWSELAEGNSSAYPVAHVQWRDDTTSATCTIPQLAGSYGNANGITVELVTAVGDPPVDLVGTETTVTVVNDTGAATPTRHPPVVSSTSEVGTSGFGSANAQPLPSGAASGDLIIYLIVNDNPAQEPKNISASTGWEIREHTTVGSNVMKSALALRVLDGTTGNNVLSVTGAAQDYVCIPSRIAQHGVTDVTTDVYIAATSATSGNADPPNLAPTPGSDDYLWLACAAVDATTATSVSAVPTDFTQVENVRSATSTSSCFGAVAKRHFTGSSLNPGAFTNSSRNWIAFTVAVPPVDNADNVVGTETVVTVVNDTGSIVVEGEALIQVTADALTSGWAARSITSPFRAGDLTSPWAAARLTN